MPNLEPSGKNCESLFICVCVAITLFALKNQRIYIQLRPRALGPLSQQGSALIGP